MIRHFLLVLGCVIVAQLLIYQNECFMLLVVSPAKNLDFESALPTANYSQPDLLTHSEQLLERCLQLTPADLSSLMNISDKLAGLNAARFGQWSLPFTAQNARPAALAFNGDVYGGLDAWSFTEQDFEFAQQHMRILSGLYGLLRPLDLMQAYRLEMGTKLDNKRGTNLYQFWGDIITQALNKQLAVQGSDVLVNLASNEYFKAVNKKTLKADIITPVFKDWKNGQYKIISFYAKKARGLMARYIIKNQLTQVDQLKGFDLAGYQFDQEMTKNQDWVFTRQQD
jgi:cytoplasmic iron level regulating protein YaaA (DUF328/UPF0246 family)